jgi:hypothetical protein
MRYMLLIYADEADWDGASEAERDLIMHQHGRLETDLRGSGRWESCNALQPARAATTVRVRSGRTVVSDGPFAETKEQLGGYYLVEAKDLAEAIAIAERIPTTKSGAVEIRPIQEIDMSAFYPEEARPG